MRELGPSGYLLALLLPVGLAALLAQRGLAPALCSLAATGKDGGPPVRIAIVRPAIVESAVRRFRPIMLTAAAAILAMVPLSRSTFFGPMAVAIMGGLIVATLLTLLFVPALYAAWYRVRREPDELRSAQVS